MLTVKEFLSQKKNMQFIPLTYYDYLGQIETVERIWDKQKFTHLQSFFTCNYNVEGVEYNYQLCIGTFYDDKIRIILSESLWDRSKNDYAYLHSYHIAINEIEAVVNKLKAGDHTAKLKKI